MIIKPDNNKLQYSGRIDFSNPKAPVFVFPCTCVGMRFTGNKLKVYVKNHKSYWDNYLGCILDGNQTALLLPDEKDAALEIPVKDIGEEQHEVLLFKRQDSCHEVSFCGFEIDDCGKILEMKQKPVRKIEVYGDSVSAGEVSEAVEYTGKEDPNHNGEYSNSWYSYAWMTARKLNAQIHDIAQGGIALMDKTGWFCAPDFIGMESVWDKVHYNPELGKATQWDFTEYTPHVVIVAIGQNDSNPEDYMKENYNCEKAVMWRKQYKAFLEKIRGQYPKAHIVCCTTLLNHDESWDRSIEQVCEEIDDENITHYMFKRNGNATPGHLRISEAEEMAEELTFYIECLARQHKIEGWDKIQAVH